MGKSYFLLRLLPFPDIGLPHRANHSLSKSSIYRRLICIDESWQQEHITRGRPVFCGRNWATGTIALVLFFPTQKLSNPAEGQHGLSKLKFRFRTLPFKSCCSLSISDPYMHINCNMQMWELACRRQAWSQALCPRNYRVEPAFLVPSGFVPAS